MDAIGFFIAVSIVSSVLYLLMLRIDRARERRRAYAGSHVRDSASVSSGDDSFSLLGWGSGSSSATCSDSWFSSSSSSSESSCGDGGGGDGGGGD